MKIELNSQELWELVKNTEDVALYNIKTSIRVRELGPRGEESLLVGGQPGRFFLHPMLSIRLFDGGNNYTWRDYARKLLPLSNSWGHNTFIEFVSDLFNWYIDKGPEPKCYFWEVDANPIDPDPGPIDKIVLSNLSRDSWEAFINKAPMPIGRRLYLRI